MNGMGYDRTPVSPPVTFGDSPLVRGGQGRLVPRRHCLSRAVRYYPSLSFPNYCHEFEMDIHNKLC